MTKAFASGASTEAFAPATHIERLVAAWGSWAPTLSPDCRRVAFVSDRSGTPRLWVQDLPKPGAAPPPATLVELTEDPVVAGIADPDRTAVAGRSYGGYLTLAALAFAPGRFAAGVDICGMSDLLTFYRDTEPWIAAAAYSKYGHPEEDHTLLEAVSPMRPVANIDVPLLVVHGELDSNVPVGEARQVVAALRVLGLPVQYLELAGEGHEYRRVESRLHLAETMVAFSAEYSGSAG